MGRLLRLGFPEYHWRKQVPLRHFIVDVASHSAKLVIEVDGGQHAALSTDADRTRVIQDEGYRVLRFWNNEVLGNAEGVYSIIAAALPGPHPHPTSPIKGEE